MANQRASGQSLVGCHVDHDFLAEIDRARGGKSRSDFMREAIHSYLKSSGYRVPEIFKYAPDRTGKGGPRKKVQVPESVMMNDAPNPDAPASKGPVSYKKKKP